MACKFCHCSHDGERQPEFSKHTRDKLNRMNGVSKLRLPHGSLQQKAQQAPGLLEHVAGLLNIMKAELLDQMEPEPLASLTGNRLQDKIAEMSVAAMLGGMLTRDFSPGLRGRLQGELRRLRVDAGAQNV